MVKKFDIKLEGVPQTLLLPLLGRAMFSEKSFSPLHDPLAVELVDKINCDFDAMSHSFGDVALIWMARAYHFDEAIKNYLQKHQNGTIVNLGSGLDTTFYRINNPKVTWIDLDLPEVIALRKKLLPKSKQVVSIAKSILDYSWMDEIKKYDDEFFFFAGGLFIYFTEDEVTALFLEMAKRFPKSELIFDSISKKAMNYANKALSGAKMAGAIMHWGIDDIRQIEDWSAELKVIDEHGYFKGIKMRKGFPLKLRFKMFLYDCGDKSAVAHVKLGK